MVGIKDVKTAMIWAWAATTVLFFLGLKFYPAWADDGLRKAFLLLFGYIAVMFGLTWKFMWKLPAEKRKR